MQGSQLSLTPYLSCLFFKICLFFYDDLQNSTISRNFKCIFYLFCVLCEEPQVIVGWFLETDHSRLFILCSNGILAVISDWFLGTNHYQLKKTSISLQKTFIVKNVCQCTFLCFRYMIIVEAVFVFIEAKMTLHFTHIICDFKVHDSNLHRKRDSVYSALLICTTFT